MGSKSSKRTTLPPPPPFLPPPPPPPPMYPDPFTTSDDPLSRRCRRKPLRPKIRAIFVPQVPTCPWNEDMENETLQRRSTATITNMGINSYSTFGAQGDLTDDKLTILPVLQDTHCITQERRTTDIKHTFYDEQLSSSNTTMNWDMETNYICPSVVHHSSNNNYIHLTECVLQTNPSTTVIQNTQTMKLNNDDEIQQDSIINTTQQTLTTNIGTTKQNFTNFTNTDLNGSKVIRLVRAKQATKRKSSLDTLIEVVQKELLRVNGQSNSTSPSSSPPHYSQTRTSTSSKQLQHHHQQQQQQSQQHRSIISSVLPSSHPSSLTSQSNHSFKIARKRTNHHLNNTKRIPTNRHRSKSFNNNDDFTDDIDFMDDDDINNNHNEQQQQQERQQLNEYMDGDDNDDIQSSSENIEDIVRDTVDKLVAITLLNNAPFIVNMITGTPGNTTSTNNESKPLTNIVNTNTTSTIKPISTISSSDYYRNDLALLSSTASELRNSMQQASPIKQQQQQQQMILQPTTSTTIQTNSSIIPTDQIKSSTPTLFVTPPRILNLQTVIPKPTTNIQIGNTKIILVSSSTNLPPPPPPPPPHHHQQQQCLVNNSPVKLVKLTSALPKNVQIVIPSRTSNESLSTTTTIHPLTTCSIDQIPQAAQEVTITTSPNLNKLRRRSSSTTPTDKPVGKILRPIAKVLPVYSSNNSNHVTNSSSTITTSPRHDEITKPMAINFQQRSTSTHGPMIYRMTSVNSNVPVFRVRATTTPTTSTINTDSKPISVATTTNMCYEPKQTHNTTTTGGSVSVLACFKTTKKRNKERAIMPRPATTDSIDTSHDLQQRLNTTTATNNLSTLTTTNVPLIINNHNATDDLTNGNSTIFSSPDYCQQSTSTRLIQQYNLPTTHSDKTLSNIHLLSTQQLNDSTISSYDLNRSSSNSIPIKRCNSIQLNNNSNSIKTITTPLISPIQSLCSTSNIRPLMEDKCIQCIDDNENSTEHNEQLTKNNISKKRNGQSHDDNNLSSDESWTVAADTLLRNVLSQYGFRFLDVNCQQNLLAKFDIIQANLVSGMISSKDEFYKSVHDIKETLLKNGLSKISADNLEKLFNYFEVEYPKIRDGDSIVRTNDRKRTRRQ
ncbi:unnamed protein product [Rotaria sordida]|uniref:Uncharacterized protein n=2 Tax=Rotaria sordida TaxID=392033 RepID=A0A818MFD2_9BILA|nr:unnamed protein product [Rotaria sordida]